MNDNLINKIIEQELQKPEENIDVELINSCVDYLLKDETINPITFRIRKVINYIKLKSLIHNKTNQ